MKHNEPAVTNQPASSDQQRSKKKVYHKPAIEIYGNLAEITETVSAPAPRRADGSHGPGWSTLRS